jgi:uncharacterized coiled-coil DUF342 family protein
MFQDDIFDEWLESESKTVLEKFKTNQPLTVEDKMVLTLKAQTNHFHHLDQDIRKDIATFKSDIDKKFEQVDRRFEQVEKRFEQVEKRFEQVDKRFDAVILRMDRFMLWSLGLTMSSTFIILGFIYKFVQ